MSEYITANDGIRLHYVQQGQDGPSVVLLHGWSGSHRCFDLNLEALAQSCRVYAPDFRFHGDSDKPGWGFHVARLAMDLHDLLIAWGLDRPTVVGCSLGSAVIWCFVELFGTTMIGKCVFVDQAPSQWRMPDWKFCSKGIYDAASLEAVNSALHGSMETFADGNAECCLSKPVSAELLGTLKAETLKCNPDHLSKLMADHATKDWRPILPRVVCPSLNLYGTHSGCFPVEGCAKVGELVPSCKSVEFNGCNHWLYMEEPARFNKLVADFAKESVPPH